MSNKNEQKIGKRLQEIANPGDNRSKYVIYTGVVKSVNTDENTCVVELNVNAEGNDTQGVFLSAALEVTNGLILYPAVDSVVWVADLDGGGNKGVIKCGTLSRASVVIGSKSVDVSDAVLKLNGDGLGGLTKTQELQTQINKLNDLVRHLVSIISGASITEPGSGAPSALQAALAAAIAADTVGDFSDIENTNVKHG